MITHNLLVRLIIISLLVVPFCASSSDLAQQRNDFLMAEKFTNQGQDEAFIAVSANLKDYPLYPMLQYQWLINRLPQTDNVLDFLATYRETRYAGLLRGKWLAYLAQQQRWPEFIQHYQPSDNVALECQFLFAKYKTGHGQQALNEAKRLWLVGSSQPQECEPILSMLALSPLMTKDLIWQRFALALQKDNVQLAESIRRLLPQTDQALVEQWIAVHEQPMLIYNTLTWQRNDPLVGRIFAHGLQRLSKVNLEQAVAIWDRDRQSFKLDSALDQQLERKLSLALAFERHHSAYERLSRLAFKDEDVREWRVRAALFEQNWAHIVDALAGLTVEERQTPHWQYWQARALAKTGELVKAQAVFAKLSEDRSFYGFLAADTFNKGYQITNKPVPLSGNELQALAQLPDFKVVEELNILGRVVEAHRQWWFAIKKLTKPQLMVAAKLAQMWHWEQIAVFTLAKADYWDDMELRFPLNYLNQVQDNASQNNLDPALVLGLIRQESVFDKEVQSSAGAKGLMQIMPKTAQQIAHDLKEVWQSEQSLLNPDVNIKYGTFYFRQLLTRFKGHVALATAAYNAGPHNVRKWLPTSNLMPADIWIETIPFKETRKYVSSVIAYAMIYQQRIQRDALRVKNLLADVGAG